MYAGKERRLTRALLNTVYGPIEQPCRMSESQRSHCNSKSYRKVLVWGEGSRRRALTLRQCKGYEWLPCACSVGIHGCGMLGSHPPRSSATNGDYCWFNSAVAG